LCQNNLEIFCLDKVAARTELW